MAERLQAKASNVMGTVTFLDCFDANHTQTIIGTALFLYLDPFIRH